MVETVPGVPAVEAGTTVEDVPEWAPLQRTLVDALSDAVAVVHETYVDDDGRIRWPTDGGGLDDAYEGFSNWPLLYLVGGEASVLDAAVECWEGVTRQFARDGPGEAHVDAVEEFPASLDWMHQGEGHQLFYGICLAAPDDEAFRKRACRFADLYLPGGVENYDPERRQMLGPMTGSEGPSTPVDGPWSHAEWMVSYHLPFTDVEGIDTVEDLRDPDEAERMAEVLEERWRGDTAVNLAATSLVTTAYLLTGEQRYREWVLEYVDAWRERTERNGGLLPDNVGPSGVGHYPGRWYGGYYGWTWPHGWPVLGDAALAAAENATLLAGPERLDFVRSTLDALADAAVAREGTLHVPYRHGDGGPFDYSPLREEYVLHDEAGHVLWREGWFEFQPMAARFPIHLWRASMAAGDRARVDRLADRVRDAPARVLSGESISGAAKHLGGNEGAWAAYLAGDYPGYPTDILEHGLEQAATRLAIVRRDGPDYVPDSDEYLNERNPVDVEGLLHCTMGAPMPLYNGGLLQGRVRHFDPGRDRPGLPRGVSALVTDLTPTRTVLELVNLGARPRTTVVQAGVYGEHEFGTATYAVDAPDGVERRATDVDATALGIALPAGTRTTLELETRRFVAEPQCAPPWNRGE